MDASAPRPPDPTPPAGDPEAPADDPNAPARDVLVEWVATLKEGQTVQLVVAYLGFSFLALQVVSVVFSYHPRYGLLHSVALGLLAFGFLVVLASAPILLRGSHPFRSLAVVAVTLVSIAGGFLLRGLLPDDPGGAPSDSTVVADSTSAPVRVDGPERDGERESPVPPTDPDAERAREVGGSVEDSPGRDGSDPGLARFEELVLIYGRTDETTVDTSGPVHLLDDRDRPVELRYYSFSGEAGHRLRVRVGARTNGSTRDIPGNGFTLDVPDRVIVRGSVRIETGCGEFVYGLEARGSGPTALVSIRLDEDGALASIRRALALDRCL